MNVKILIVDDEKQLVHYLRQALLLDLPAAQVDLAYSGEEALSHLAGTTYDLILADLRMPGFDGLQLIKGVRYLDSRVPIVLMTGYGSTQLKKDARQLGVDEYVDKPFNMRDVMDIIHRLLGESKQQAKDGKTSG